MNKKIRAHPWSPTPNPFRSAPGWLSAVHAHSHTHTHGLVWGEFAVYTYVWILIWIVIGQRRARANGLAIASWGNRSRKPVIKPRVDEQNEIAALRPELQGIYGHVHILHTMGLGAANGWVLISYSWASCLQVYCGFWLGCGCGWRCACLGLGLGVVCVCFRCSDGPSLFTSFLYVC